jgi:hypothetical protein
VFKKPRPAAVSAQILLDICQDMHARGATPADLRDFCQAPALISNGDSDIPLICTLWMRTISPERDQTDSETRAVVATQIRAAPAWRGW